MIIIWNVSYMNCVIRYEIKWSCDLHSYERNFCNCVKTPEKLRTSTGFEPMTLRYRCDALTNWAMKPLTLGAGHLCDEMIYEMDHNYMNCGYEIKWSCDLRSYEHNFCNCVKKPQGHGFKPRWIPEFFRLLYAIAKIAFITAKITASLKVNNVL